MPAELLTNSRIKTARSCLRRHRFEFTDAYRPRTESQALRFGTLMHRALEAVARGQKPDWHGQEPLDTLKAQELLRGYLAKWGTFQGILAIEAAFECPLPSPDLESVHSWFRLAGKIDLVIDSGGCALLDHKTTSESVLPESPLWVRLALDTQISHYFIGAESLGFRPVKWIHDVIRKPEIEPRLATPEASRKYTKEGRLYANQRAEDETLDEYRERLRDDILSRPEWYFARREVVRLEGQIVAHLRNLWQWAELLDHDPQNADACVRFGVCPFFACCSTGSEPADHPDHYVKVENIHPELENHAPCST